MIDSFKLKFLKRVVGIIGLLAIFLIGFGFGQIGKSSEIKNKAKTSSTKKAKTGDQLDEKWVEKFLISYYTKRDLEENRNRYKEYMTQGMYNAIISEENKAQNQAYKGYVINYEFKSAQIYIDQTNHRVICNVIYTNDLLKNKDSLEGAQTDVANHLTIQLDYSKVNNTYLVNHISSLLITDSSNPTASQEAYGNITSSETTSE